MKVLLVGPEFEENLSLRYLASALEQAGHVASMARFDSEQYVPGVVKTALECRPAIIGLSMVFQVRAREFFELARALRAAGYTGHITAGGHFATFACEAILKDVPEINSIIRQEGEKTLVELANALDRGTSSVEIAGICGMVTRGDDGATFIAPPRIQTTNLDTLAFPVRDATPEVHLGVSTAFMVGSRGCYADCEYCSIFAWHEAAIGKRYRMRSVENIATEMEALYFDRGVRFFVFHDDNFFLPTAAANRKRFLALEAELNMRGIRDIGLMLKLRPNDCDAENIQILKRMGLLRAFVGIENASQRQLRTLGRDSTVEDVEACLRMLKEQNIYATYNILLFDPYTTLDDVRENIRFLRNNTFYPFNWCKVEPYAGTELEKRYGREGRLIGDYLGYDYRMDDPRTRTLYELLSPAFYYRNFDYFGLANLNIGMGYHVQLLKHFYRNSASPELCAEAQRLVEEINRSALDLMEAGLTFVQDADLTDRALLARFSNDLKIRSFELQHSLSSRVENVLTQIEIVAGVRAGLRVGGSETFTPLIRETSVARIQLAGNDIETGGTIARLIVTARIALARIASSLSSARASFAYETDYGKRTMLTMGAGAILWMLAGCHRNQSTETPHQAITTPHGVIHLQEGFPSHISSSESFALEATLLPAGQTLVEKPKILCEQGTVSDIAYTDNGGKVQFRLTPSRSEFSPAGSVIIYWIIRTSKSDLSVSANLYAHELSDGGFALGYQTPRPTIAEMAAPPIRQAPTITE